MDFNRKVAERAYELWVKRGRPHGSHEADWLEAERQLSGEAAVRSGSDAEHRDALLAATFPASDPPASRLPDEPPVNAPGKWAASKGTASTERATRRQPEMRSQRRTAGATGEAPRNSTKDGAGS